MSDHDDIRKFLEGLRYTITKYTLSYLNHAKPDETYYKLSSVWTNQEYPSLEDALIGGLGYYLNRHMGIHWQNVQYTAKSLEEWLGADNAPIVMTAIGYYHELLAESDDERD